MKFVPLQVSSPRSGFSLYMEPAQYEELRKHYRLGSAPVVYIRPDAITVTETKVEVHFDVSAHSSANARMLASRGRFVRAQIEPIGAAMAAKNVQDFGMLPAKLWFLPTDAPAGGVSGGGMRLEFDLANLPPAIQRNRAGASPTRQHVPTPEAAPVAVAPKPATVPVLLTIAGKDMMFNLPIETAFNACMDWTQAGYKEPA